MWTSRVLGVGGSLRWLARWKWRIMGQYSPSAFSHDFHRSPWKLSLTFNVLTFAFNLLTFKLLTFNLSH
jgi:hypothetical protein